MQKQDIYKYTGDVSQVFYAKQYRLMGGRADGMRAVDINNGNGLEFTVLADRAMDIARISSGGINLSYTTKAGNVHPSYGDDKGAGWLKTFAGGFLTTCGLTQVGSPCECDGEQLGLHGRISIIPAEDFCVDVDMDKEVPEIIVKGKMRMGSLFGYNLWLTREIRVKYGENKIYIKDKVENRNGEKSPYMILYHFNLGYPLLDESITLDTSAQYVRARDEEAAKGEDTRLAFEEPQMGYKEQVFYYKHTAYENNLSYAAVFNKKINTGVKIWVNPKQLPNFIQWKNPGYGDYVMGIESGNCYPEGRLKQKEYGLEYIEPMAVKTQEIVVEIL